jgi:hypothetical protein
MPFVRKPHTLQYNTKRKKNDTLFSNVNKLRRKKSAGDNIC